MTVSVRTRRDVVIVDAERFLAAARAAYLTVHQDADETEAAEAVADVHDAAHALIECNGHLVAEGTAPEVGLGAPLPGERVPDRPDGLSPAGWLRAVVVDEQPLQDYGCLVPTDPFALPHDGRHGS